MGITKQYKKLHNNSITVGDGEAINVIDSNTLTIQVSGTAVNFKIDFMASLDNITYFPYEGCKLENNMLRANSISNLSTNKVVLENEGWQFNCVGISYIKTRITEVEGGNITIIASVTGEKN